MRSAPPSWPASPRAHLLPEARDWASWLGEPPAPLIGRDDALADVLHALQGQHSRLVTLTGPGGVGKTSLALEVARRATDAYPDGIVFVPLEALDDPALVISWIAARVGISGLAKGSETEALHGYLRTRRMLLVLDNLEHLLPAAGEVAGLVDVNPGLTVLVTSRAPLRLRGEREYQVEPLTVPDLRHIPTPEEIATSDAVQMFLDRARVSSPSFDLTQANAAAIAAICRRLDGLPLALELAAARLRILNPTELLARLDQSLPLLTGGPRDLPERQRTIRQAITWSDRLLGPDERALFRRLSVFTGGWDVAAAETLGGEDAEVLAVLSSLVEHSLVVAETTDEGATRYRMLETIRQFGNEQLAADGEAGAVRDGHLAWFVTVAETADTQLHGSEQRWWLQRLEQEHGNLRAALSWALDSPDVHRREEGLRLASALWSFWYIHGHFVEGEAWLQRLLAGEDQQPTAARAKALFARGMLLIVLGEVATAVAALEASLHAARVSENPAIGAQANYGLGDATRALNDYDRAERHYRLAQHAFQELGDDAWAGISVNARAVVAFKTGALERAEELAQEGLRLLRFTGENRNTAEATGIIGEVARLRHDTVRAARYFGQALASLWEVGDRFAASQMVVYLSAVAVEQGHAEAATRLAGAASAAHVEILRLQGDRLPTVVEQLVLARARQELGEAAFDRAWQGGRALSLDSAVAEALALAATISVAKPPARPAGLSSREVEVVRLVATGLTNGQIADQLFLSRRTVDAHMRRIYDKLDLATRMDVVRFAMEHGLA